jgi:hypothetical protein
MKWSLVLHNEDESFHLRIGRRGWDVKTGRLQEGKPLGECRFDLFPRFVTGLVTSGLE